VFSAFFIGAIICMGMSTAYHTMSCHTRLGKLFERLDYVGIAVLIVGSFVPWVYYGFYCRREPKIVYTAMIVLMAAGTIFISLSEKFGEPQFRPLRAGVFICTALSGIFPCLHFVITDGYNSLIEDANFYGFMTMASLYLIGAVMYAARIPERFYPGKFDVWFHSHQIFHMFVIVAEFVHFKGISEMADRRLMSDTCSAAAAYE